MTFDEHGNLAPYELIETDLTTFERVFVQSFPQSDTRQKLFTRYREYNGYLSQFLPQYRQWLDGSFISRKLNPNDVDMLTFVDWQLYEQYKCEIDGLRQ